MKPPPNSLKKPPLWQLNHPRHRVQNTQEGVFSSSLKKHGNWTSRLAHSSNKLGCKQAMKQVIPAGNKSDKSTLTEDNWSSVFLAKSFLISYSSCFKFFLCQVNGPSHTVYQRPKIPVICVNSHFRPPFRALQLDTAIKPLTWISTKRLKEKPPHLSSALLIMKKETAPAFL